MSGTQLKILTSVQLDYPVMVGYLPFSRACKISEDESTRVQEPTHVSMLIFVSKAHTIQKLDPIDPHAAV